MSHMGRLGLTVAFAALAVPAVAQTTTQEGADRIRKAFQTYMTDTPGVVTVSPTGEGYKLVLDAAPLAARAGGDAAFRMSPLEMVVTDRGDGTWGVTQDQPFEMELNVPGTVEFEFKMARAAVEGVWDESLMTFSTYSGTADGIDYVTVTYDPSVTEPVRQVQRIEAMTFDGTGTAGAGGGVDLFQSFTARGLTQSMPLPPMEPGGGDPALIGLTVDSYTGETRGEGLRGVPILDLVAFFVRNPSEAALKAQQEELRGLLTALMPVFDRLDGTIEMGAIRVATPVGEFGLQKLGVTIEAKGAVSDGLLREAFRFEGLTLPAGVVPDWAVPLVPGSGSIDVAGSGFDLAAVASRLISAFDLTKTPPIDPAVEEELAGLVLPSGTVTVTFAPGEVTAPVYGVTWEGEMKVGPASEIPVGRAKVTARGLNEVRQALTAAPPEMGGPASMGIGAAVAVGRTEADGTTVWEIEANEAGEVRINGRLMPMGAP